MPYLPGPLVDVLLLPPALRHLLAPLVQPLPQDLLLDGPHCLEELLLVNPPRDCQDEVLRSVELLVVGPHLRESMRAGPR